MYDLPRIPLPTSASSADLARLPASIRQQALFSARLNLVSPVVEIGAKIKGILDGKLSESEARRDIRASLAAAGYKSPSSSDTSTNLTGGSLLDHTSKTRLDLILEQNVRSARGYGKRAADMDPDLLDLWPAQELVRVMSRRNPRGDWKSRWRAAGGRLVAGRMVALKTSPVWVGISRFGMPYPPFDFGSGMGVVDVDRDQAVRLGLLKEDDRLTPDPIPFPETAEANLPDLSSMPALQASIAKVFGGGATFQDGKLTMGPSWALPAEGNASEMDLQRLGASTVLPSPAFVTPREAHNLLSTGQAITKDPAGRVVSFAPRVLEHWAKDKPSEIDNRLTHIRHAFATVQAPQEIWERSRSRWYLREFDTGSGGKPVRMLVMTDLDGKVITWIPPHSKPKYFDRKREGALLVKEGA